MFALYAKTGGDLAASLAAAPTRGCVEILNKFRYTAWNSRSKDTTPTGCTRWGITAKGANFVALDGSKADRYEPMIAAWGGILAPTEVAA
jgi:hypothetical protein